MSPAHKVQQSAAECDPCTQSAAERCTNVVPRLFRACSAAVPRLFLDTYEAAPTALRRHSEHVFPMLFSAAFPLLFSFGFPFAVPTGFLCFPRFFMSFGVRVVSSCEDFLHIHRLVFCMRAKTDMSIAPHPRPAGKMTRFFSQRILYFIV